MSESMRRTSRARRALPALAAATLVNLLVGLKPVAWTAPRGWQHMEQPLPQSLHSDIDLPVNAPLKLQVSSPAVLLNHVADRYSSTPRILMEFVDNALDDAEHFFDSESNSYQRPVKVEVLVDPKGGELRITDNCRGMSPEMLRRVTTHVGESTKRGQSFVNGQFGFGMQAFRACCQQMVVSSRTEPGTPALEIEIDRDMSTGFVMKELPLQKGGKKGKKGATATSDIGTTVSLKGFSSEWKTGENDFSVAAFQEEIELHFERLLSRGNLEVAVVNGTTMERHVCRPEVYADINDAESKVVINETISIGPGQKAVAMLAITSMAKADEMKRQPRFFVKGRRISNVIDVRSFFMSSANRWTVWNHPQVTGYFDIIGKDNGALRPVITRDDFKTTPGRAMAFNKLMDRCEQPLLKAIEAQNMQLKDKSMRGLEDMLTYELSQLADDERKAREQAQEAARLAQEEAMKAIEDMKSEDDSSGVDVPPPPAAKKEKKKEDKPREKKNKQPFKRNLRPDDFKVKLVRGLSPLKGADGPPRSRLAGNAIMVDIDHPDFEERFKTSKAGRAKVDERVCAYLATVVAAHFRDARYDEFDEKPQSRMTAYADMISTFCTLETRLRKSLPTLNREMERLTSPAEA